jgi:pimeloyl-ACP methyl ester carboxylesterase
VQNFDPATLTAGLNCPSLHLFGSLDDDVPTEQSARILDSLPGKERRTVKVFNGTDHFMLAVPKRLGAQGNTTMISAASKDARALSARGGVYPSPLLALQR